MRTDGNPLKINPNLEGYKKHRIIMPVYIPHREGYYKDALDILKISLESLIATVDVEQTNITVINNNCFPEVDIYIRSLHAQGHIDQYIVNKQNRGKYDAILAASKSTYEPFITITDADALFAQGWLNEVDAIYEAFPNAGVVCPFPAPNLRYLYTFYTWLKGVFFIRWGKIVEDEDLTIFARNVGLPHFFSNEEYRRQFYLKKGNTRALIGCGHFVATYRNIVFRTMPQKAVCMGLKGADEKTVEKNVDSKGLMRLSLPYPRVFHMGNTLEDWMAEKKQSVLSSPKSKLTHKTVPVLGYVFRLPEVIREVLMKLIFVSVRSLEKMS